MKTKTIVLIHGLFVNELGWDEWQEYFEKKGYTVYAPAYPGHKGVPSELRAHPPVELSTTGLQEVLDYFVDFLSSLPEKPIAIGHSAGGLVMQKLLEYDLIAAGVSLNGAPTKDVPISLNVVRATLSAANFFKSENDPFLGSKKWYHKQFFNKLSDEDSAIEYEKWATPESRKIVRDMAFTKLAAVDHTNIYQPVLFITGSEDNFFGPELTAKIVARYQESKSPVVDFKVFEGHSHSIYKEDGWQEVIEYVNDWLKENVVNEEELTAV
ncbi:MAG: alpha/beta hydrolase [Enterococcus sp.]